MSEVDSNIIFYMVIIAEKPSLRIDYKVVEQAWGIYD